MKTFRPSLFRKTVPAVLLGLLQACASLPGQKGNADAVITASGLDAQLELLKQPLKTEQMDGPLSLIPDEWITLVNTTIATTLKPEQIRASLRSTLEKNLSGTELGDVQKFYESEIGRHVAAIESGKITTTPVTTTTTTNNNNRATLDILANATGAGKAISVLAQHGLNDAVDVALENGCFGLDKIPFASVLAGVVKKTQLNALKENVNISVRQQYAQLSGNEQASYLAFAQSAAGQKFFSARSSVMTSAAQQTGAALSEQLTQHIRQICTSSKS